MKIELGKKYLRRDGQIAGPLEQGDHPVYVFDDPTFNLSYTADGKFLETSTEEHRADLITLISTEETVSKLPQGLLLKMIPGKYYKTSDGDKMQYLGKDVWLGCAEDFKIEGPWEEEPMRSTTTTFKVGDRVKHINGMIGYVDSLDTTEDYPYYCVFGNCGLWCLAENLELIQPEATSLPPEPIPGQYYRTRGGRKMQYVGKAGKDYVYLYSDCPGSTLYKYIRAYDYAVNYLSDLNIVGEWTEPLPAVEIKRWAVVFNNTEQWGLHYGVYTSIEKAESAIKNSSYSDELEIIELVGTLPSKEIT